MPTFRITFTSCQSPHISKKILYLLKKYSIIFALCSLISCSNKNEIAIKINDFEITRKEFDYDFSTYFVNYENKYRTIPPKDSFLLWYNKYIDECFLLAEAYKSKVQASSAIKRDLAERGRLLLTQKTGFYNRIVIEDSIREDQIKQFYELRKNKYKVNLLLVQDSLLLEKVELKSVFDKGLPKLDNKAIKISCNVELKFPNKFFDEIQQSVLNLKPGQISKPLKTSKGIFVVQLLKLEPITQREYYKEKHIIEKMLFVSHNKTKIENIDRNLLKNVDLRIDTNLVIFLQENEFKSKLDKNLYSYIIANKRKYVSAQEYFLRYNNSLIKPKTNSVLDLISSINYFILQDIKYQDSYRIGIDTNEKYIKKIKNYQDQLVLNKYLKQLVKHVDDKTCYLYYYNNINKFSKSAYLEFYESTFNNEKEAYAFYSSLNKMKKIESKTFKNSNTTISAITNNTNTGTSTLYPMLFNLKLGTYTAPYKINNKYHIFYKRKEVIKELKPYMSVKKEIESTLSQYIIQQHLIKLKLSLKHSTQTRVDPISYYETQLNNLDIIYNIFYKFI
jgi:hypothetical protein